ncbi:MAG: hypothetical protein RIR00_2596 [Pseudomonadota bacterium]|jgi:hypothetical protein
MPEIIHLHPRAPAKPVVGAACNGCGVCCALETCPLARLRFLRRRGPCPALEWMAAEGRYHCGLLSRPADFIRGLPAAWVPRWQRLARRWIAAGQGCDCDVALDQ